MYIYPAKLGTLLGHGHFSTDLNVNGIFGVSSYYSGAVV